LGMVFTGALGIFIFSGKIIHFFAGERNDYISFLLRLFCVAIIIVSLNIPACLVLLAGDHKKNYLRIFTIGMVICITANFLLAPVYAGKGTVYAVLITEIFITGGLFWELSRLYRIKKDLAGQGISAHEIS